MQLFHFDPPLPLREGWYIGNTCFMNALFQCFRQLLGRLHADLQPTLQSCPLAIGLQQRIFTAEEMKKWDCWNFLPIGPQRDACHILEICVDDTGPMHKSCEEGNCYAALFRHMTSFEMVRELLCKQFSSFNSNMRLTNLFFTSCNLRRVSFFHVCLANHPLWLLSDFWWASGCFHLSVTFKWPIDKSIDEVSEQWTTFTIASGFLIERTFY